MLKKKIILILFKIKSLLKYALNKLSPLAYYLSNKAFEYIPANIAFQIVILNWLIYKRFARFLLKGFSPSIHKAFKRNPEYKCDTKLTEIFPFESVQILFESGLFTNALKLSYKYNLCNKRKNNRPLLVSNILFELENFDQARIVLLNRPINFWINDEKYCHLLGLLELLSGNEASGLELLATLKSSEYLQPHQNISARYKNNYSPTKIDYIIKNKAIVYDAYNFLGQRLIHVGQGDLSSHMFAKALNIQDQIRSKYLMPNNVNTNRELIESDYIEISEELQSFLVERNLSLEEIRILPWEWVTQIGHMCLMDILFRMRELDWWSASAILLIPEEKKIANNYFLSLFDKQCHFVIPGKNVSQSVADELFSLQRLSGFSFNAWRLKDNSVIPWQNAAGDAMWQWDNEARTSFIKIEFDKRYRNYDYLTKSYNNLLSNFGIGRENWYVCLHIREPSFYGEILGNGQTHRNSNLEDYVDAIKYISDRGGWVIRVGSKNCSKLPDMERLRDYARCEHKSELMDLALIRNAAYFIGATSGLANLAISFDIPCALVNCISTDAQPWNKNVRFALKPVLTTDRIMLKQNQLTSSKWRWRMFCADVLRRYELEVLDNTSDEILETVKEVDCIVNGGNYAENYPNSTQLIDKWQKNVGSIHYYGNSLPSLYFLSKYESEFLD